MRIYQISIHILFLCKIVFSQVTTTTTLSTTTVSTTTTSTVSTTITNLISSTTALTTPSVTTSTTSQSTNIVISSTPHSPSRNPNQDFGVCNCDLTSNQCDVNCCCDKLCTSNDLIAFNNCTSTTSQTSTTNKKWCVPANELFIQNTPYILNAFGDLLCVDINNSLSMNYYQAPLTDGLVLKESYVNDLVKAYYPTVIQTTILSIDFDQNATYFTNDDYIWVVTSNGYLGFLRFPIQVGATCVDGPPLNYLDVRNSSCTLDSTAVINECTNSVGTSLSLQYFIQNFKIIPSPPKFKACGGVNYACSSLLNVNLRYCKFGNGQPALCPSSSSLLTPQIINGKCQNLVKKITYIIQYKNPDGFTKALVDVEFFDGYDISSTTNSYFTQNFEIRYAPSTASLDNYIFENKLSGNPGYQLNQPLVAGYYDGTKISVNQDRFSRFTVLQANKIGQCSTDDSNRISIRFGLNLLTECKFQIALTSLSDSACKALQSQIDNIILGSSISNRPNVFAPFATSPTSDYNQIVNSNPDITTIYNSASNMCKSVRTSASIQIAYALVGNTNTNNPQAEIQYISYDWSETSNINLRCSSQTCNSNNQLKLSTRVTFVDVSQPPLYTQSQVKRPRPTLPGDFFYPFGASFASKLACSYSLIIFISFFYLTLFFTIN